MYYNRTVKTWYINLVYSIYINYNTLISNFGKNTTFILPNNQRLTDERYGND